MESAVRYHFSEGLKGAPIWVRLESDPSSLENIEGKNKLISLRRMTLYVRVNVQYPEIL